MPESPGEKGIGGGVMVTHSYIRPYDIGALPENPLNQAHYPISFRLRIWNICILKGWFKPWYANFARAWSAEKATTFAISSSLRKHSHHLLLFLLRQMYFVLLPRRSNRPNQKNGTREFDRGIGDCNISAPVVSVRHSSGTETNCVNVNMRKDDIDSKKTIGLTHTPKEESPYRKMALLYRYLGQQTGNSTKSRWTMPYRRLLHLPL